ncbi:hypothetical protein DAI21_12300 [Lelliottia sp. WB101]|uniref:hypothetical protein n=1 Tax=Lelliottia sp. WB101 TaxID=2153385 RepID=UPI000D22333C|nr:hypothetical protein [Lelliottia sp. WB101]AVY98377.1 hypothetical protein DAI21_12300 [Lelliottia sp. WB101]
MDRFINQPPTWENYLGDLLRGNAPVNQLIPDHPYLLDTLKLEEILHKNTTHIMLLTMDEAYAVADTFYNYGTTYAGNIKDTVSGLTNIFKFTSFIDADKLVFRLKGLGIKAVPYFHKGVAYIKITGYPSVRRILNGTRYAVNHPKILEIGIGQAGIQAGILSGARFCIYFAAAQRVVEYIFSSEHDVATFIGNITADVAKVIVSVFITKMLISFTAAIAGVFSVVIPISAGIFLTVLLGFIITRKLVKLDETHQLSRRLIESIKEGIREQQKILEWNMHHSSSFLSPSMDGGF